MPRPTEPEKRAAVLDACYAAARGLGSLDVTLAALAERTGVSARMLVHYFGSRDALQRELGARFERELRERFDEYATDGSGGGVAGAVLGLWDHLAAPEMRGPLRLLLDLMHRAQRGDAHAAEMGEREIGAWTRVLEGRVPDPALASALVLLFVGAAMDLLATGDATRGRRAIEVLLDRSGM
jgi:AcrR family transcriptional regulator